MLSLSNESLADRVAVLNCDRSAENAFVRPNVAVSGQAPEWLETKKNQ